MIYSTRARELNHMKEATDYVGPPIAARRWRRRRRLLQFHRSSESKFKYGEESRRNSPAYANGRHFYVRPEMPFPLVVGDLSTIEIRKLRASGIAALPFKCH